MTASEARRSWFRLLDEVAAGAVVAITRNGRRIVIRREESPNAARQELPDYSAILRVPDADSADGWSWDWDGPEGGLTLRDGQREADEEDADEEDDVAG